MIGLLVALKKFVAESDEARGRRFRGSIDKLYSMLADADHARVQVTSGSVPKLELQVLKDAPRTAMELCVELERGNPSVHADPSRVRSGVVVFSPWCLKDGDAEKIAARVKPLLRY